MYTYYVYILTNIKRNVMYVGVTNDLGRRVEEHRQGTSDSFTQQYKVNVLVHAEEYESIDEAIAREKQIKGWRDQRKTPWSRPRIRLGPTSPTQASPKVPRCARDDINSVAPSNTVIPSPTLAKQASQARDL